MLYIKGNKDLSSSVGKVDVLTVFRKRDHGLDMSVSMVRKEEVRQSQYNDVLKQYQYMIVEQIERPLLLLQGSFHCIEVVVKYTILEVIKWQVISHFLDQRKEGSCHRGKWSSDTVLKGN